MTYSGGRVYGLVGEFAYGFPYGKDPDALRFINTVGTLTSEEKIAVETLVMNLKVFKLWSKMTFIYPMVGGTLRTCSYNLVNPSLYQITWFNTPTASRTGVRGNGINQYGLTGINVDTVFSDFDVHLAYYSRTSVNALGGLMSAVNNAGSAVCGIYTNTGPNMLSFFGDGASGINVGVTNTQGLIIGTRTSASLNRGYRNKTLVGTQASTVSPYTTGTQMGILCENRPSIVSRFSTAECAFACGGTGLTPDDTFILAVGGANMKNTDAQNLSIIVDIFQQMLQRNV